MNDSSPAGPSPHDVIRGSRYHERFLEYNRGTRDSEEARRTLAREWRYVGPLLSGNAAPRVLDLGCGSGSYSLAWAERGARVTGVDFDPDLLRAAAGRVAAEARVGIERSPSPGPPRPLEAPRWICGDAAHLPIATAAFQAVFCNSVFEHVREWRPVLAELARVLEPGGLAVVYTTNRYCPHQVEVKDFPFYHWLPGPVRSRTLAWIMEHRRDLVHYTDFPALHWFTFPQMRRAFREVGLEPLDRMDVIARTGGPGMRGFVARAMRGAPALKLAYYVRVVAMAMYGIKRGA